MKIVVGISGGVDSAVAALLLKKAGHDVIGLFMRNWDSNLNNDILGNPDLKENICPQEKDYQDALAICEKINIPLKRVDFIKEYWDFVFTYFLDELKKNRTPNPDIMCNKYIKFDLFVKEAKKLGADKIATGHYARIINNQLVKGIDKKKDQSYFLSQIDKNILKEIIFPIGDLTKQEVRQIAKDNNLLVADKKDSTGICFIGNRDFKSFLANYLPNQPGEIVNIENNQILGKHNGLMYYTIGQRRGLNVGGTKKRLFVVGKDIAKNQLLVCIGSENEYLLSDEAIIEDLNLFSPLPLKCSAKFRYQQADQAIEIVEKKADWVRIKYNNIKAVTPGQACVFYDNDVCLGGGIIKSVYFKNKNKYEG